MIPAFPKPGQVKQKRKYLGDDGVFRYPDGREKCDQSSKAGRDEYQRRKLDMWNNRQGRRCKLQISPQCKARAGRWPQDDVTFDHEDGRGGGKQDDRIEIDGKPINAAVCWFCNSAKGSRRMSYLIDTP